MECKSEAVVGLMITELFLYGFMTGGEFSVISEFAPDFSGTVYGIAATIAVWPSFVTPYVVGVMLGDSVCDLVCVDLTLLIFFQPGEMSRWKDVFYITIGVCMLGTIAFIILGSAEPQEWGLINKNTENKENDVRIDVK